jgi:hypothetical protein
MSFRNHEQLSKQTTEIVIHRESIPEEVTTYLGQAIINMEGQQVVQDVIKEFGRTYFQKFIEQLQIELFTEVTFTSKESNSDERYVSLAEMVDTSSLEAGNLSGEDYLLFRQEHSRTGKSEYLVNLVFPCRNSSALINRSFDFLFSEIRKSAGIDFNVIFQVNNTKDNTIEKLVHLLLTHKDILSTANFYILETDPKKVSSLPGSLNLGYQFGQALPTPTFYKETFFSFWDDELTDAIPTSQSLFNSNIDLLLESSTNKAISGYMVDNRTSISRWHELCKGFSSDIRFLRSKPYLHGGAGMICRIHDFPITGIKLGGIADTDLSEHLLELVNQEDIENLPYTDWPIRINPDAPVFHPIETNIVNWTVKYLMYQIAWENTYRSFSEKGSKAGELWQDRIEQNRQDFHIELDEYLRSLSPGKILERALMRSYYGVIQSIPNKKEIYERLKSYRSRSYTIR